MAFNSQIEALVKSKVTVPTSWSSAGATAADPDGGDAETGYGEMGGGADKGKGDNYFRVLLKKTPFRGLVCVLVKERERMFDGGVPWERKVTFFLQNRSQLHKSPISFSSSLLLPRLSGDCNLADCIPSSYQVDPFLLEGLCSTWLSNIFEARTREAQNRERKKCFHVDFPDEEDSPSSRFTERGLLAKNT